MNNADLDTLPDLEFTLNDHWPELKRARDKVRIYVAIGCSVAFGLCSLILATGISWIFFIFIAALLGLGVYGANKYLRGLAGDRFMPAISRTSGLEHQREFENTHALISCGLLPDENTIKTEDALTGQLGEITFASAEVKIQDVSYSTDSDGDRTKSTTTYFDGLVIEVKHSAPRPRILVAPSWGRAARSIRRQVRGHANGRIKGLRIGGEKVEVYASDDKTPDVYLSKLNKIVKLLPRDYKFFSAYQDDMQLYLALTVKRDLYALGGLLMTKETVRKHIMRALEDMQLPLKIVGVLLEEAA